MKSKKSDAEATQKLVDDCEVINNTVAAQIDNIEKKLKDIQKTWFNAAHQQEMLNNISEKTLVKIDNIHKVEFHINKIIDEITMSINTIDVDEIEGKSSDMIL